MTKSQEKTKKDKESQISKDLDTAIKYQNQDNWLKSCREILGMIENRYPKNIDTPFVVNTFFNLRTLLVPSLYYEDPELRLNTEREDFIKVKGAEVFHVPAAEVCQLYQDVLHGLLRRGNARREFQKSICDAITYGWGCSKTGISTKTDPDTNKFEKEIYLTSVCPEDLLYDPMASGTFDNCAFVAHHIVKDLDDIKEDENLKNTKDITGFDIHEDSSKGKIFREISKETGRKYIDLYEYHDQKDNKVKLVARDYRKDTKDSPSPQDSVLKTISQKTRHGKSHFSLLRFETVNDKIRGVSLLETQKDEALAINQTLSLHIKHLGMFGGILVYERGALTEQQLLDWQSSKQGDILEVEPNTLLNQRFRRESPLQLGADYFNSISMFHQLIDRCLGIPDFQGLRSTKRKSATESAFEQADTSLRRNYFLGFVKDFIIENCFKLICLAKEHLSKDDVEELIGRTIDPILWEIDVKENWLNIDMDVESLVAYNQSMAQGFMQALPFLAQFPPTQAVIMKWDGEKIANKILKGFNISSKGLERDPGNPYKENDPHMENMWATAGRIVPDPQPAENHEDHALVHLPVLEAAQAAGEMKVVELLGRHMQMHMYYANPQQNAQQGTQQPQQQGQTNLEGQGPALPMNNAEQAPTPIPGQ